jgi:hypothetical protein
LRMPWFTGDDQAETLEFLTEHELPFVCVDMPQGHRSSIPPVLAATSDLAVVRFHGHSDKWTSTNLYDKFGYLYSDTTATATTRNETPPTSETSSDSTRTTKRTTGSNQILPGSGGCAASAGDDWVRHRTQGSIGARPASHHTRPS